MSVRCEDREGECFARRHGFCMILLESAERCSFKKPTRTVTKGVEYPYNPASCGDCSAGNVRVQEMRWKHGRS